MVCLRPFELTYNLLVYNMKRDYPNDIKIKLTIWPSSLVELVKELDIWEQPLATPNNKTSAFRHAFILKRLSVGYVFRIA